MGETASVPFWYPDVAGFGPQTESAERLALRSASPDLEADRLPAGREQPSWVLAELAAQRVR